MTIVGSQAFKDCSSMRGVILRSDATIAGNAFNGCTFFEVVNLSSHAIQHGSADLGGIAAYARSIVGSMNDSTLKRDADGLWHGISNHSTDPGKRYAVGHDSASPVFPEDIEGDEEYDLFEHIRLTPPAGQSLLCLYVPYDIAVGSSAFQGTELYYKAGGRIPESDYPSQIPGSYFLADASGNLVLNYSLVCEGGVPTGTLTLKDDTGTVLSGPQALDTDAEWSISGNTMTFKLGVAVIYTITAEPASEFQNFLNHGTALGGSGSAERMRISGMFSPSSSAFSVSASMDPDMDMARYTINGVHGPEPWDGSAVSLLPGEEFAVYFHSTAVPYGTKVIVDDGGTRTESFIGDRYVIPSVDRDHNLRVYIWDDSHTRFVVVTIGDPSGGSIVSPADRMVLMAGAAWGIKGSGMTISDAAVSYGITASPDDGYMFRSFTADGDSMGHTGAFTMDTQLSAKFKKEPAPEPDESGWDDPVWRNTNGYRPGGDSGNPSLMLAIAVAAAAVAALVLYVAHNTRRNRSGSRCRRPRPAGIAIPFG